KILEAVATKLDPQLVVLDQGRRDVRVRITLNMHPEQVLSLDVNRLRQEQVDRLDGRLGIPRIAPNLFLRDSRGHEPYTTGFGGAQDAQDRLRFRRGISLGDRRHDRVVEIDAHTRSRSGARRGAGGTNAPLTASAAARRVWSVTAA